jgi:CRP-like cAMP-binding protein
MHSPPHGINIEALLMHVPLFNGLEGPEIARLARGTREIKTARGDILFHKGDTPTGFHLVVYGQMKLAFTSPQGSEKVVDIVGQGQTFGEAVMFMEMPFMVYAQALTDSLLLHIPKTVDADPKFVDILGKMIAGSASTFGEAVMFMEKPFMVYAQALTDSLLLHIPKAGDQRRTRR